MYRNLRDKWTRSFLRTSSANRKSGSTGNAFDYSSLEARSMLAALPIISEFVASNNSSLEDGFGASPDWIELHNAGDTSVDLIGYHLTDDFADPNRWTFDSSTVLNPGDYLVVFASGNAIPDPEGNLHTNFSLSASGEYLALTSPAGTVLSEFGSSTTDYPALEGDEAFGLAFDSTVTEVVTPTSASRFLNPAVNPGDNSVDSIWTGNNFDDSAWESGFASLGYEEDPADYAGLFATPVDEGTTTLYVRIQFENSDPSAILDTLQLRYDDGFIAYLNGTEIASENAPANPAFDSTATDQHSDSLAVDFVPFDVSDFNDDLVLGTNTLAIHLLNRNSGSSDLLISPILTLTSGNLITPVIEGRLAAPTPGSPNTNILASAVEFSQLGGVYSSSFSLALSSTGPNETIRFTTNGSEPTQNSPIYNAPFLLSGSTQVRARAFGALGQQGPISVETYTRADNETSNFTSDLPILVIEALGQGIPGEEFEDAALSVFDVDDTTGRSSLSDSPELTSLIGQHRRGSSTFNNPKPNLRIETRDVNGDDLDVSLLDLPEESDFVLSGPYRFDRALIRDTLLHELYGQTGNDAVRTRFVEVYGNYDGDTLTNDDYLGVYFLVETIKIDDNRVDIANLDADDNAEPDITGGYILAIDRSDGEPGSSFETTRGVPNRGGASFVHIDPERVNLSDEQTDYIRGYVQDLEDALYGPNSTDPELGYEAFLDVEASIDHHIFRTLSLEPDSLGLSTFLTKDRDGKLAFGPLWDSDRSQGADVDDRSADPEVWFSGVDFFEFDWWGQLFNDPDFTQQWIDRWNELRETTLSDANILGTINAQAAQLVEAQARNFARWPEVAPNGGEFAEPGLTGWEAEISHLSGWLMERVSWIDGRLISTPTLDTDPGNVSAGSQVELSTDQSRGTIFYTLDGTDPRDEGGNVSPNAIQYTGPFTLTASTQVTARVFGSPAESQGQTPDTSPWSNEVSGLFSVESPASPDNLRISELHYHPAAPTATELLDVPGVDEDNFEFVELVNISNETISLNGVALGTAVGFDFTSSDITSLAPGETVLVVENIAAFEARYGTGFPIAGAYSGRLANGGERVTLTDSVGQLIHDFTYDDAAPWAIEADGQGPSLEVVNLNGDYNDPANWRISTVSGGTPAVPLAAVSPQVASLVRDGGDISRPDQLTTLSFAFDSDVNVVASDLFLLHQFTGFLVDTSGVVFSYESTSQTATWDFSSLPDLEPAYYGVVLSENVTAVAGGLALDGDADGTDGGNFEQTVYVALPGDANLDGQVDVLEDAFILVSNLGQTGGGTWAQGDFNADGNVNVLGDGFVLVSRLGQSVIPPATSVASFATSAASFVTYAAFQQNTLVAPLPVLLSTNDAEDQLPDLEAIDDLPVVPVSTNSGLTGSQQLDEAFADTGWVDRDFPLDDVESSDGDASLDDSVEIA